MACALTLIVDPLTKNVYSVPAACILYDKNVPVKIEWTDFVTMSAYSGTELSAATFIYHPATRRDGLRPEHIVVVQTSRGVHWASRMQVELPESHFLNDANGKGTSIAGEFIWLWPVSLALQQWLSICEEFRRTGLYSPLVGQMPERCLSKMRPGVQLGAKDFEGAEAVGWPELNVAQRYFVHSIRPLRQTTSKRAVGDNNRARYEQNVDAKQEQSMHRRRLTFDVNTIQPGIVKDARSRLFAAPNPGGSKPPPPESIRANVIRLVNASRLEIEQLITTKQYSQGDQSEAAEKPKRRRVVRCTPTVHFFKLPTDLTGRVISMAAAGATHTSDALAALRDLNQLRLVSREFRRVVDDFLGGLMHSNQTALFLSLTGTELAQPRLDATRLLSLPIETLIDPPEKAGNAYQRYAQARIEAKRRDDKIGTRPNTLASIGRAASHPKDEVAAILGVWSQLNPKVQVQDADRKALEDHEGRLLEERMLIGRSPSATRMLLAAIDQNCV